VNETKPNAPAEFTVQSQAVSDEDLDAVTGGVTIEATDALKRPFVARTYF